MADTYLHNSDGSTSFVAQYAACFDQQTAVLLSFSTVYKHNNKLSERLVLWAWRAVSKLHLPAQQLDHDYVSPDLLNLVFDAAAAEDGIEGRIK